jgi:hypothetical protein
MFDRCRRLLLSLALMLASATAVAQTTSYQGLWWAAPAASESGWGVNFTHQGDVIFATWFTYDTSGQPLWLVATLTQSGPSSFAGELYRTEGPAMGAVPFDPARVRATGVGNASVAFTDAANAAFTFTVAGVTQTKAITPQVFRSLPACRFVAPDALAYVANFTGLWWAAPAGAESGWGINFAHQEDVIFATWFTYGANGQPLWLTATLARQGAFWSGDLYRASGPPLGAVPFDPSRVTATKVGAVGLQLGYEGFQADGNAGTFTYSVDGVSQTKKITQQVFRDSVSACTQTYSIDAIRAKFDALGSKDMRQAIAFAERWQLSAFHVDFLTGSPAGTATKFIRESQLPALWGGARIAGYGLPFARAIVTSTNPAAINYPADYSVAAARDVVIEDPYCNPEPATIAFPAAYLGNRPLPAINVTAGRGNFRRMAYLKDVWGKPSPNFVPGCRGDPKAAMRSTLARLKALNIDTVFVTPWTDFDPTGPVWRVLNPAETLSSTMGDADLEWFVAEAKARGLAVFWRNQIQGTRDGKGNAVPYPPATVANVLKSYDALEVYLEERGAFLQRIGVDGVSLGGWYWAAFQQILSPEQYVDRNARLIRRLKAVFKGKVTYDAHSSIAGDPYLAGAIDFYEVSLFAGGVTEQEAASLTVPQLKAKYRQAIDGIRQSPSLSGKPIIWNVYLPSRSDVMTTGYLEETFCTAGYDLGVTYATTCIQAGKTTDFALQAIAHEASLEAIFEQDSGNVAGVSIQYWMDDNLLPSFTFPNLANSIRGKPAEAIVYQWFRR